MDSTNTLISHISEEIYQELKTAIELGHWQSGTALSEAQKNLTMQALIAYESKHIPETERTAYIYKPEHEACDSSHHAQDAEQERPIKFKL